MQETPITQMLFMWVPMGLIFYFFLIRPQRQQQKKMKEMLASIKKNDEVVTSSGIHGTVVILKEKTIVLRVDDNCRIEFDKEAVTVVKSNAVKAEVIK